MRIPPGRDHPKPSKLDELIAAAEKLGGAFSFARIDPYEHRGHVYFGEITNAPGAGLATFCPTEFDRVLGALLKTGTPILERYIVRF